MNFLLIALIKIVCVIVPVLTMVAYAVLVERKISAFIQDRVGPNRTVPKLVLKEDFTPAYVRKAYFWLAPAITMVPAFLVLAVIPFGSQLGQEKMVIA